MQLGLLFHALDEQAAGGYVNQWRVDVQGLDTVRFRAAWQATVDAQDILRSGFVWQGQLLQPLQLVHKKVQLPFTVLDWREHSDPSQALAALADTERAQGFDLSQAPLLRLVRSEERRVGKECVSTCRSRWRPDHEKKTQTACHQ